MKYFMFNNILVNNTNRKLVEMFFIGYTDNEKTCIFHDGDFKEIAEGQQWSDYPTFYLPINSLIQDGIGQAMLDCLLSLKIKPSTPIENKEELQAIKYHLEDMRKLIFKDKN